MVTLEGVIERITYHNEENGYTVAWLAPEGREPESAVPVVGHMLGINVGECVRLTGEWTVHKQYGRQFKVETFALKLPATVVGIEKYLGSGLVRGVGPVTAKRIVRKFGLDTLRVIDEEPERLREVLGVGPKRVAQIKAAWHAQRQIREVMVFLQGLAISPSLAVRIYKQYGDSAMAVVRNDPYRLAREVDGIGFVTADKIARSLGIAADAPERVAAGVAYALSQKADEGHVYVPQAELVKAAAELLGVPPLLAANAIEALRQQEQVHVEPLPAPANGRLAAAEERAVYLLPFYRGEIGVAGRLRRLLEAPADRLAVFQRFDWPQALAAVQRETRLALTPRQAEAVRTALTRPITVLTGGPGTGKTTCMRTVIRLLEAARCRYALASPTGRAAKRLSEATGRPAKTIHRLLEAGVQGGGLAFQRNEANPLDVDMVIVDEASMLDLLLANHLLKAIPPGAHLLLVGDIDQLPPVGAGNVLRDVIESGAAAVVRLDVIFRQAEGSFIIENAHRINQGRMPEWSPERSRDFFLFQTDDPDRAAELVVEIVQERIPRKFGIPPEEVQVLSPMHRGAVGVGALNERLQQALNPPAAHKPERRVGGRVFRLGDRVLQVRNNYDKEVFNGDLGRIVALDLEEQTLAVRFDDRTVTYDFLELDELVHAFAMSVHKAQGSEFPAVVIPLLTQHYMMLQRNLLYTAVTRAKQLVVLVGTPRAVAIAVHNNRIASRYSGLAERLR
ncbi:MAG: ATP-dependent RecD-like DNA helicase [Caldilineales bacterium]|nr:ATP-dependent RecD-like DNA helicase [Caldilineales bacterium]MDW8316487.1 ATP-dependent RecD-like DNA helicase [Anaerolineae bacterium]